MQGTTLIVARHGNTFNKGETPRRVGARTDLDLVESGKEQAKRLGQLLKAENLLPDVVYTASLKRAYNTASIALERINLNRVIKINEDFNEIDYGPDENKTEEEVIARIGQKAIDSWNTDAIVPKGWNVNPKEIINSWHKLANKCLFDTPEQTTMIVTSNGIARFLPYITGDFTAFCAKHSIKLSTGAIGVFRYENNSWKVKEWNKRP